MATNVSRSTTCLGVVFGILMVTLIARVISSVYHSSNRSTLTKRARATTGVVVITIILPLVRTILGIVSKLMM